MTGVPESSAGRLELGAPPTDQYAHAVVPGALRERRARQRRIGIVAVARKLLIELWRYHEMGVLPEGAMLEA